MTQKPNQPDLEGKLESIEDRVRQGRSVDDLTDPDLQGAAAALQLIQRVKSQEEQETVAGVDTVGNAEPELAHEQLPRQLGRFEIREHLGQGGFGVVLRAFDPDLQRDVAIKVPRPETITTPELRERFLREGRAAAALAHPHIVPVFEAGSVGPICYTASQFVPGQSLAGYQLDHPLTVSQAAGIIQRLAEATEHAHQRGVLHRDIKPGNILVRNDNSLPIEDRVQLTDFGLAKNLAESDQQTREGHMGGTPAYMPPEQISSLSASTAVSDVYALGAVLYELLTAQPPFAGETIIEVLDKARNQDAAAPSKINSQVPADLDAICLKCLEKEPASRYSSAFDLAEDLGRFQRNEAVEARRIGPMLRISRWYGRHKVVASAVSLAFLFLVLGLAGTLWMYAQSQSNLAVAQQQTSLAGRGLDRTRRTVDRLLTDVSQALADRPGMDKLRQRLLAEAREIYEEILNDDYLQQVDTTTALDSFYRIAVMESQMGNHQECQDIARQGLDEYERLPDVEKQNVDVLVSWSRLARLDYSSQRATGRPARFEMSDVVQKLDDVESTDVQYLESLAEIFRQVGIDHLQRGEVAEGIQSLESAIQVIDAVDTDAHANEVLFLRAQALNSLGIACKANGEPDKAIEHYQKVVSIMTELLKEFPERPRYQEMRAIISCNLGNLQFNAGDLGSAKKSYQLSMEACRTLRTLFPERRIFWDVFGRAATGVGLVARKQEDFETSSGAYEESIAMRREFRERFGGGTHEMAIALGGMATLLKVQKRWEEARPFEAESVLLRRQLVDQFPDRPPYKKALSLQLGNFASLEVHTGNLAGALEYFEEALQVALDLYHAHPQYPGQLGNINYQFRGVANSLATLDRDEEMAVVVQRQADLIPDDAGQIQRAVMTLGSVAEWLAKNKTVDTEVCSQRIEAYRQQAETLIADANELGVDTADWLNEEPARALKASSLPRDQ